MAQRGRKRIGEVKRDELDQPRLISMREIPALMPTAETEPGFLVNVNALRPFERP